MLSCFYAFMIMNPEQLLDRFSTHLKNAIARAMALATSLEQAEVNPLHLLISLLEEEGSLASEILRKNKINSDFLYQLLNASPQVKKNEGPIILANLPILDNASRQIMEKAMLLAYERGHQHIGTEHLLWGYLQSNHSSLQTILNNFQINKKALQEEIENIFQSTSNFPDAEEMSGMLSQLEENLGNDQSPLPLGPQAMTHKNKKINILQVFTTNLTDKQIQKNIDPVIGREKEVERLINILSRRTKNNPVLIGEPGVGKTAIVEGLAKKISEGQVPAVLRDKKILSLDITLLLAGTIYRGEFEGRLKQVIEEISKNPNIILFIDELHNIIGAGSSAGSMDAANILKPALARGQLRCIGATTFDEYKKHISNDPALERRFQSVIVEETNQEETKKILSGVKKYYENFHQVKITDEAIDSAVTLSNRYVHDNFQPDKALDLIDEACASVKANLKLTPAREKLEKLKKDLENLQEKKEQAIRNEKFTEAIEYKKQIQQLERKISTAENKIRQNPNNKLQKVGKKEVVRVLANRLNIQETILMNDEWQELETLPARLNQEILGQETAIEQIVRTLKQKSLRLSRAKKPFASLLFSGPSGVGKTALAKTLAKELFHDEKSLIRLDMSEFSESHSTSKLLGSPAGYVGHKERNRFLDEIKKRPYCVLLWDEVDKAHPDVAKLLLQILDEGELTDATGKKINLEHTVVILTTNLGSELFRSAGIGFGKNESNKKELEKQIFGKLKSELSSALLSRLDSVVVFSPLNQKIMEKILAKNLNELSQDLKIKNNFGLVGDERALSALAQKTFHIDEGARQAQKILEDVLQDLLIKIVRSKKTKQKYTLTYTGDEYKLI